MPPWRPWTVLTEVFIFYLLGLDCEGQKEVTVRQGEDATLECYGPSDAILLRWTKPGLQTDDYVFYLKDGHFQEDLQNDLFKGRVKLKDSKRMNNGNFSVTLQDVTMNDSGTYECEAAYNNQPAHLLNRTSLMVEERGQTGGQSGDGGEEDEGEKSGSVGPAVGLSVPAVLLVVAVVGFVIYRKYGNSKYQYPFEQGQQMEMSS